MRFLFGDDASKAGFWLLMSCESSWLTGVGRNDLRRREEKEYKGSASGGPI